MEEVMNKIRTFRDERDWMQFHDPKNLAVSIVIESAELLEHFQWKDKAQVEKHIAENLGSVADEIADVAMYLFELADKLAGAFKEYYPRAAGRSEIGAWQQSFNFLKNSFEVAGLNDNQIIIEYELPYSSRRIDALLFGQSQTGDDGVVLIELKQWSNDGVANAEAEGNVKVRFASGVREVAHPSWQVEGYHFDLQDFLHVFQDKPAPELSSCSYCNNYARLKEPRTLF